MFNNKITKFLTWLGIGYTAVNVSNAQTAQKTDLINQDLVHNYLVANPIEGKDFKRGKTQFLKIDNQEFTLSYLRSNGIPFDTIYTREAPAGIYARTGVVETTIGFTFISNNIPNGKIDAFANQDSMHANSGNVKTQPKKIHHVTGPKILSRSTIDELAGEQYLSNSVTEMNDVSDSVVFDLKGNYYPSTDNVKLIFRGMSMNEFFSVVNRNIDSTDMYNDDTKTQKKRNLRELKEKVKGYAAPEVGVFRWKQYVRDGQIDADEFNNLPTGIYGYSVLAVDKHGKVVSSVLGLAERPDQLIAQYSNGVQSGVDTSKTNSTATSDISKAKSADLSKHDKSNTVIMPKNANPDSTEESNSSLYLGVGAESNPSYNQLLPQASFGLYSGPDAVFPTRLGFVLGYAKPKTGSTTYYGTPYAGAGTSIGVNIQNEVLQGGLETGLKILQGVELILAGQYNIVNSWTDSTAVQTAVDQAGNSRTRIFNQPQTFQKQNFWTANPGLEVRLGKGWSVNGGGKFSQGQKPSAYAGLRYNFRGDK